MQFSLYAYEYDFKTKYWCSHILYQCLSKFAHVCKWVAYKCLHNCKCNFIKIKYSWEIYVEAETTMPNHTAFMQCLIHLFVTFYFLYREKLHQKDNAALCQRIKRPPQSQSLTTLMPAGIKDGEKSMFWK